MLKIEDVFDHLPSLETDRLILRRLNRHDAKDMFAYTSDPEISRFTTWNAHQSLDDALRFIEFNLNKQREKQEHEWAIVHKRQRRMIGTCGYVWWKPQHHLAEIAYAISREYWGQGLMTEALHATLRFGFERMELNRVEARCMTDNIASERVMQKVGMKYEGTLREQLYAKGKFHDLKLYAILRREYLPGEKGQI
jgi:ribosomal-protein-alanine N-acetyltransferase